MPRGGATPLRLDPGCVRRAGEPTNADVAVGEAPAGEFLNPPSTSRRGCPSNIFLFFYKIELELRPTIVHADIVKKREAHVAALLALSQPVA